MCPVQSTRVVHCKKEPYDVYIGRGSPWGNPFKIGPDGTRDEVVAKYRAMYKGNQKFLASLEPLRGKRLGCWCAPLLCHGHVLLEFLGEKNES